VKPTATTTNAQIRRLAVDDILTQLRSVLDPEMPVSERLVISDAIEEIERLRNKEQDLRMHLEQDACEIQRLRRELAMLRLVRLSEDLGLYE
jgi:ADP-dependent phosphofructokinase/glucokinase